MLKPALEAAEALDATVANMRFVKPLDLDLVKQLAEAHELLVTVEEHQVMGGAGSAVCEALTRTAASRDGCCCSACPTASSTTAIRRSCSPRWGWTPPASSPSIRKRNARVIYSGVIIAAMKASDLQQHPRRPGHARLAQARHRQGRHQGDPPPDPHHASASGGVQHTIATFNMYVGLPHQFKGTHMSRFVEILNAHEREITVETFQVMLREMVERLEAEEGHIEMSLPVLHREDGAGLGREEPDGLRGHLHRRDRRRASRASP